MKLSLALLAIPVLAPVAAVPARADSRGDELLGKLDAALNSAKDQTFQYAVVTVDPGKEPRKLEIEVHVKGDKRLTTFLAPGDMKGTKALTLSTSQIYVWLPAYQKVRRVASHASRQSFMGTAVSSSEMALSRYAPHYEAKVTAEDAEAWELELAAKPGGEGPYPVLRVRMSKEHERPLRVGYVDESGKLVKTETRSAYACEKRMCTFGKMEVVDHRDGKRTTFERVKWAVDTGLDDDLFTTRRLSGGR